MLQNGKLMPNLDQLGTRALNLTVLQRMDPAIEEILITVSHVTIYDFNMDQNQWSRKDVEGSLFVVKRNTQPRFQFIVMNRRSTENLVEDLLGDFEYEVQPPYLLYRTSTQAVNGIWFYFQQDCENVANLFGRIINAYSKVPPKTKVSSPKSEYEELEAVPTSTTATIINTLEGPTDTPDDSFLHFFTSAANIGNAPGQQRSHHQQASHVTPHLATSPSPSPSPSSSSAPLMPPHADNRAYAATSNLITPSLFHPTNPSPSAPVSTTTSTTSTTAAATSIQRSHVGPSLVQPYSPTAPASVLISRDKVRDALLRLLQNDQFIDLVYREMQNSIYP